jgi:hypothetical protein
MRDRRGAVRGVKGSADRGESLTGIADRNRGHPPYWTIRPAGRRGDRSAWNGPRNCDPSIFYAMPRGVAGRERGCLRFRREPQPQHELEFEEVRRAEQQQGAGERAEPDREHDRIAPLLARVQLAQRGPDRRLQQLRIEEGRAWLHRPEHLPLCRRGVVKAGALGVKFALRITGGVSRSSGPGGALIRNARQAVSRCC